MKVEREHFYKNFEDVAEGECFTVEGETFLKTRSAGGSNCVSFYNGSFCKFAGDERVEFHPYARLILG